MKSKVVTSLLLAAGMACAVAPAYANGVLKVCADPAYLPYSNRAGEGFENDVAEIVAKALDKKLEYTWASYRMNGGYEQFLSETLDAGKCDVAMNMPYGNIQELTTDPYYVSSYVFVFKKAKNYDIETMDSQVLRQVQVGFEQETPAEIGLQMRGLVQKSTAFDVAGEQGTSPETMLDAVQNGKVDVMITWEPAIGAFLSQYPDLAVVRVPNERAMGAPEKYAFPMSMAVRKDDTELQAKLNQVIKTHEDAIDAVLKKHNVRLYKTDAGLGSNIY